MDTAYYLPVGEKQIEDWKAHRVEWIAHLEAVKTFARTIGAVRFNVGLNGGIVAADFGAGPVHLAFSKSERSNGSHALLSRGRSQEQKDAIDFMSAENSKLSAMQPRPFKVASSHGFIDQIKFAYDGGEGSSSTARFIDAVDLVWPGEDSFIALITGDIQVQIDSMKNSEYYSNVVVTPDKFETPEGYERITKTRYDFMVAEYNLRKEEEANN